ncbi:MAG: hypothetical protein KI790_20015 [Cyclobacteriaceae bacterium]|nr:hypothetical protein [Cyclobacteriaceae bacterium HetDA_MAG_MS6]
MATELLTDAKEMLVDFLKKEKQSGSSAQEALSSLKTSTTISGISSKVDALIDGVDRRSLAFADYGPALLSAAVEETYGDTVTPLEMAQLLKDFYGNADDVAEGLKSGYSNLTATQVGELLLDDTVFPDLTKDEMQTALSSAGFDGAAVTAAVNTLYPPSVIANFSKKTIATTNCQVSTGPGSMYNSYYGNSWIMHSPGRSFIKVTFNQTIKSGSKKLFSKIQLNMTHLTSSLGPRSGYSPVNIIINGTTFKSKYSPPSAGWVYDKFNVTDLIKDGANTIQIDFVSGARSNYWINKLQLVFSK